MTRALLVTFAGLLLCAACGKTEPVLTRCTPGLARCDASCVDFRKDPENCGACGTACVAGEVCSAGACALSCQAGLTDCDGICSSLRKDPENCGACGVSCGDGEVCSDGTCVSTCGPGQIACKGACTNIVVDPANCGGCGKACELGEVCVQGTCKGACPPGFATCGGACSVLTNDSENCGECGNVCGPGLKCSNGKCAVSCQPGLVECNGLCTNLQSDVDHCGACGTSCGAGQTCSAGKCVLTCQPGLANCGGTCTNTQNDDAHCGACGNACATGKTCTNGVCSGPVCPPNTTQSCYSGPPGTQGVGVCKAGTRTCNSSGSAWSPCNGQVLPSPELCADNLDNDCNGVTAQRVFFDSFANNAAGWLLGPEWAIGPTSESMCSVNNTGEDPASDHTPSTDNGVAGVVLGGCYATSTMHPASCLISPSINAAGTTGPLTLSYWRHLHTDYPPFVDSRAEISGNGGVNWTKVWETPNTSTVVNDAAWTQQVFNVTGHKSTNVRLRFCFTSNGSGVWAGGGWSLDDVMLFAGEACQ